MHSGYTKMLSTTRISCVRWWRNGALAFSLMATTVCQLEVWINVDIVIVSQILSSVSTQPIYDNSCHCQDTHFIDTCPQWHLLIQHLLKDYWVPDAYQGQTDRNHCGHPGASCGTWWIIVNWEKIRESCGFFIFCLHSFLYPHSTVKGTGNSAFICLMIGATAECLQNNEQ